MASKIHFNSDIKPGIIELGPGSSVHKNPSNGYGNMQATSEKTLVDCKSCLKAIGEGVAPEQTKTNYVAVFSISQYMRCDKWGHRIFLATDRSDALTQALEFVESEKANGNHLVVDYVSPAA